MSAAKKKINSRATKEKASKKTSAKRNLKMVWWIFNFIERFELGEDIRSHRKSALDFTRDYVGVGAGNEAVGYQQQLSMLSNCDGEEYYLLYGIYRALINEAGKRSRAYRGYLLDAANEPLSDAKIGKMFKIHARKMTRLLRRLESVKLLVRVRMPDKWDLSVDEVPPKKGDSDKAVGAQQDKKSHSRAKNKGVSGRVRKSAEKSVEDRKPLKGTAKTEIQPTGCKGGSGKRKATNGLTAVGQSAKYNGKAHGGDSDALEGQKQTQGSLSPPMTAKRGHSPTTAPLPSEPHGSDARGSRVIPFTQASSGSVNSRYAQQYGVKIYLALGLPWDIDSVQARREIGSFSSKFSKSQKILAGALPEMRDELWRRGIDEARKIRRRGRKNRKPGAVWCGVFDKLVDARLRAAM